MCSPHAAVRWMVLVHCGCCLILCLSTKSKGGGKLLDSDTFNLSSLFVDTEHKSLQDLSGFWSYNDTSDISKYEDFDHSKLLEQPGLKLDLSPGSGDGLPSEGEERPLFDTGLTTNISVQLGGTATLYCRVSNAKELRVSWVRRRDWHILTSGSLTYTNDERFSVIHADNTDDWDLQIKYVQRRDNGTYECQVATSSGILSHYYNLHVIVPTAFILGSGEYHIGEGSTISIVCVIENSPSPPQQVFWYHNDRPVSQGLEATVTVTVTSEPGPNTHSRLVVSSASPGDTGNYTCSAPETDPDTIYVFVTREGENTAAIQRQSAPTHTHAHPPPTMLALCLLCACALSSPPLS